MARQPKPAVENETTSVEPVTELVTYLPGPMDPPTTKWLGHTMHANVPKPITCHPDHMEIARGNKFFSVGNAPRARESNKPPKTSEEYRAYMIAWLGQKYDHTSDLIARFVRDRELQIACEVGADDYAYLGTLFMPKLHELARADEFSEQQVASMWLQHGVNQLPW